MKKILAVVSVSNELLGLKDTIQEMQQSSLVQDITVAYPKPLTAAITKEVVDICCSLQLTMHPENLEAIAIEDLWLSPFNRAAKVMVHRRLRPSDVIAVIDNDVFGRHSIDETIFYLLNATTELDAAITCSAELVTEEDLLDPALLKVKVDRGTTFHNTRFLKHRNLECKGFCRSTNERSIGSTKMLLYLGSGVFTWSCLEKQIQVYRAQEEDFLVDVLDTSRVGVCVTDRKGV